MPRRARRLITSAAEPLGHGCSLVATQRPCFWALTGARLPSTTCARRSRRSASATGHEITVASPHDTHQRGLDGRQNNIGSQSKHYESLSLSSSPARQTPRGIASVDNGIATLPGESTAISPPPQPRLGSRPPRLDRWCPQGISRTVIRFVAPVAPVRRPAVMITRAPVGRPAKSLAVSRADSISSSTDSLIGIVLA